MAAFIHTHPASWNAGLIAMARRPAITVTTIDGPMTQAAILPIACLSGRESAAPTDAGARTMITHQRRQPAHQPGGPQRMEKLHKASHGFIQTEEYSLS